MSEQFFKSWHKAYGHADLPPLSLEKRRAINAIIEDRPRPEWILVIFLGVALLMSLAINLVCLLYMMDVIG